MINSCRLESTQGDARCLYPGTPKGFVSWWLFLSLSGSAGVFICIFKNLLGAGEEGAKPESPPWKEAALAQASDAGLDPQETRGNPGWIWDGDGGVPPMDQDAPDSCWEGGRKFSLCLRHRGGVISNCLCFFQCFALIWP